MNAEISRPRPESQVNGHDASTPPVRVSPDAGPPTHPLELALVVAVGVHLSFLPWALGAMHPWAQWLSLACSLVSFVLAATPRRYPPRHANGRPFLLKPLPSLLRSPIFWIGATLLAYVLVQAVNPAWRQVPTATGSWLRPVPHVSWLPTSVSAPFAEGNPWHQLLIYGSAWLSACAIWIGFTRRRTLRWLLLVLAVNAGALGALGLLERASGATKIFWVWKPPADYFVASFIYRNHAGAYFDLMLSAVGALLLWQLDRPGRDRERSGFLVVLLFVAAVVAETVLASYSRGAVLLMIPLLLCVAVLATRTVFFRRRGPRGVIATGVAVFAAIGLGLGLHAVHGDRLASRMEHLRRELANPATNTRVLLARATIDLASDAPWFGWGAGSFEYVFHGYQLRYPAIVLAGDNHRPLRFEHAHDDYLELWAELGLAGCLILAAGAAEQVVRVFRAGKARDPVAMALFAGCVVTALHATFDFPFANPAVLVTWCCLWSVLQRWLEFEARPASRTGAQSRSSAPPSAEPSVARRLEQR